MNIRFMAKEQNSCCSDSLNYITERLSNLMDKCYEHGLKEDEIKDANVTIIMYELHRIADVLEVLTESINEEYGKEIKEFERESNDVDTEHLPMTVKLKKRKRH